MLREDLRERALLPVLMMQDGPPATAAQWPRRRQELLNVLQENIYGYTPPPPDTVYGQIGEENSAFLADKAIFRRINLRFTTPNGGFSFPFSLVLPKSEQPVPLILHIAFRPDLPDRYMPAEEIIDQGFGLAYFYYMDVSPDSLDGDYSRGLGACFRKGEQRDPAAWGRIGHWAYAASRVMDYLQTLPEVDHRYVSVAGHSRLGKTALWCGAQDKRFFCSISNDSGFAGAAVAKGGRGEKISDFIRAGSWDWFCERFKTYLGQEDDLPYDQHLLLACIAPRRICVGSAQKDIGADPKSEFLSCLAASESYHLLGLQGLVTPDQYPEPGTRLHEGEIGYHLRTGTHFFSRTDWLAYMAYLKKHMNQAPV